jgi:hypothetical protein
MGCYTVPVTAAIFHFIARKKIPSMMRDKYHSWLNQLFLGGAIFGVVDHWWNKQLLRFTFNDIMLGYGITAAIILVWAVMVGYDQYKSKFQVKSTA